MTIEKVYDELISMISDLQKKGGGGGGGGAGIIVINEYTQDLADDNIYALVIDNELVWVFFRHNSTNYTIAGQYLGSFYDVITSSHLINQPIDWTQDNISKPVEGGFNLKVGAGTFQSYFLTNKPIAALAAGYDTYTVKYKLNNGDEQTKTDTFTTENDMYLGCYYEATTSYHEYGLCYSSGNTRQSLTKVPFVHTSAAAPSSLVITEMYIGG